MQDIIANIIVAAAILFLIGWMFRNFVSKKSKAPSCGSCPQCATKAAPDSDRVPGSTPAKL